MTFDIIVFEEDELADGSLGMKQHPENGVQASSRKELVNLYAMSGQKIKILREYGGAKPSEAIKAQPSNVVSSQVNAAPVPHATQQTNLPVQQAPIQQVQTVQAIKAQPQYYKIGDVEIKIADGISYQKQFVKLTDAEASNIRVVDNKTNKVMNLNGKSIEMKRWIRVEASSDDTTQALEESLS